MLQTHAPLEAGTLIAEDFEVVRLLGEGGMGAVYLVQQRSTGKPRALKVMHPSLVAEAGLRARFEREAHIAGRVDSPHVVEVIAAGVDATTRIPWIAMELLRGEDLGARLSRGPLSLSDATVVMRQVGHALAAAHRVGIVHRDLKPENIFLDTTHLSPGEVFRVKVLDFGVAFLHEGATPKVRTQAVGSPLWMAPEQMEASDRVGPHSDVWALGLVAFTMLTGRCFWRAGNDSSTSLQALLCEVLFEALPSASERAAQYGLPALPSGFDAWFARAVTRAPESRFRDAAEAVAAFGALHSARPSAPAIPPTLVWSSERSPAVTHAATPSRVVRRPPRGRGLWIALAASGLVALLAGFASARSPRSTPAMQPLRARPTAPRPPVPPPASTESPPATEAPSIALGTRPPTDRKSVV